MKEILQRYWIFFGVLFSASIFFTSPNVSATPAQIDSTPTPTPKPTVHIATLSELQAAQSQWARSRHANTYDDGLGANTTCASCKSPRNWDPYAPAAEIAHDCSLCKREPGKPRPPLPGGVLITQSEWKSITCDVCHQPVGNSYSTALSFWNQETQTYEAVSNSMQLCNKCHTGAHGFDVIREQSVSPAHRGWDCIRCHGSHNATVKCIDCHDITQGRGAVAHAQHPNVDCTACHDAGDLPIWQDPYSNSRFFQKYMPLRTAHDLRSWPSHNLQTIADCRRCHHPQGKLQITVAPQVRCDNQSCHAEGASFDWCPQFPRDAAPKVTLP
ncbi:MAG: hypothetical protein HZB51_02660 [Chloroflexi bacterium]|nr:hypothetical protein [Chloroflexota bacterium]